MSSSANTGLAGPAPKIAFVELHDARVGGLTLKSGGGGVLGFSHIAVYIEQSVDRYDVWSYHAELLLDGIQQLSLDGLPAEREYVMDGSVLDADGRAIELAAALDWTPADKLELAFFTSEKLSMKVSRVRLSLGDPLSKIEEWDGPLA
jgi:hypothetical protein